MFLCYTVFFTFWTPNTIDFTRSYWIHTIAPRFMQEKKDPKVKTHTKGPPPLIPHTHGHTLKHTPPCKCVQLQLLLGDQGNSTLIIVCFRWPVFFLSKCYPRGESACKVDMKWCEFVWLFELCCPAEPEHCLVISCLFVQCEPFSEK